MSIYFIIIIGVILFEYILSSLVRYLNLKALDPNLPEEFSDTFDGEKYIFEYLNNIFDDIEDQCYVDSNHLTNGGQEIIANKVARNIISSKILDF